MFKQLRSRSRLLIALALVTLGSRAIQAHRSLKMDTFCDPIIVPLLIAPPPPGPVQPPTHQIATNPTGTVAVVPSPDSFQLLRVTTDAGVVLNSATLSNPISRVVGSPTGTQVAAVSSSGSTVTVFNSSTLAVQGVLGTASGPTNAQFSPDGTQLFVACGIGQALQVFNLATMSLAQMTTFSNTPSDVTAIGTGSQLAVAMVDSTQVVVLNSSTLVPEGTIPVTPGSTNVFFCPPPVGGSGNGHVLVTSGMSNTLTVADAGTLTVLNTITCNDPARMNGCNLLADFIFVEREGGTKIDVFDCNPLSIHFGQSICTIFVGMGGSGFQLANLSGFCFIQSSDRTKLIAIDPDCILNAPFITSIAPNQGVPGTQVTAPGTFGGATGVPPAQLALFMRNEVVEAVRVPTNLTATTFEAEVPLGTNLGPIQLWVSRSSEPAVASGTFMACTPHEFQVLGVLEALSILKDKLSTLIALPSTPADAVPKLGLALVAINEANTLLAVAGNALGAVIKFQAALNRLIEAQGLGATLGGLDRQLVEVIQFLVFQKVNAAKNRLGVTDAGIEVLLADFTAARNLLLSGTLTASVAAFETTLAQFELIRNQIAKLTKAQLIQVLFLTIPKIVQLEDKSKGIQAASTNSSLIRKQFTTLRGDLGDTPDGHLTGTVIGNLVGLNGSSALESMNHAQTPLSALSGLGVSTSGLRFDLVSNAQSFVKAIADAVQTNVGDFDEIVALARSKVTASEIAFSSGSSNSISILLDAMPGLNGSFFQPELLHACKASAQVISVEGMCVGLSGIPPTPTASTVHIQTRVGHEPTSDEFGIFILTGDSPAGATELAIIKVALRPPGMYVDTWDGKDAAGNVTVKPGPTYKVRLRYICLLSLQPPIPGDLATALGDIPTGDDTSLIITPWQGSVCSGGTLQFKATTCVGGGIDEDVTDSPDTKWGVTPKIGTVSGGLFKAKLTTTPKQGIIFAQYHGRVGRARVTILPTELAMQGVFSPQGRNLVIQDGRIENATKGVGRFLETEHPKVTVDIHRELLGIDEATGTKIVLPGSTTPAGLPTDQMDRALARVGLFSNVKSSKDVSQVANRFTSLRESLRRTGVPGPKTTVQEGVNVIAGPLTKNGTAPFDAGSKIDKVADLEKGFNSANKAQYWDTNKYRNYFVHSDATGKLTLGSNDYFLQQFKSANDKGRIYEILQADKLPIPSAKDEYIHFSRRVSGSETLIIEGKAEVVAFDTDIDLFQHTKDLNGNFVDVGIEAKSFSLPNNLGSKEILKEQQAMVKAGIIKKSEVRMNGAVDAELKAWAQTNTPDVTLIEDILLTP